MTRSLAFRRSRLHLSTSQWIAVAVVFIALAATALAWGNPVHAQAIVRGGTLTEAFGQATQSLDAHLASSRANGWLPMLYDTMFTYKPVAEGSSEFVVGPGLAESYEVVDPTTIQFNLRRGVKFHDGSDWNADVAKWNFERAKNHELSVVKQTLENVEAIEIVDDYTLRFKLAAPQPLLPLQLTPANNLTIYMASKQAVESMGDEAFGKNPVGSGPFKFSRWLPDDRLELERFPNHWELGEDGQPLPYVDRYVWRLLMDQAVANIELRTGGIQVLFDPATHELQAIRSNPALKLQSVPGAYQGYPSLYFNPDPSYGPFSQDVRLRRAAQHATDRESLAAALGFGVGEAHYHWGFYPGVPGYDPDLPKYEYDLEKARQLVREAGYPNGVDVEVKVINRTVDTLPLEVIQAMWAEAGIRLRINMMDRLQWVDDGTNGHFEALSHGNTAQPSPLLRQESHSESTYNWAGYANPKVDALWAQAAVEYDDAKRVEIYKEIQRIVQEDAYHFVGYRLPRSVAMRSEVMNLSTHYNLRYVWLDN